MKYTEWSSSFIGKRVKCVSRTSGFGGSVGNQYYIKGLYVVGNNPNPARSRISVGSSKTSTGTVGGWAYLDEFEFEVITLEMLEEQYQEYKKKATECMDKIDWLKNNHLKEIDDDVYKTYRIMKVMNIGDMSKAKEVVDILNS